MSPFHGETLMEKPVELPNDTEAVLKLDKALYHLKVLVGEDGTASGDLYTRRDIWVREIFTCAPGDKPKVLNIQDQVDSGLHKVWST